MAGCRGDKAIRRTASRAGSGSGIYASIPLRLYRQGSTPNRPAQRPEKRNGGREAACGRGDWTGREAEQIVSTKAAGTMEPTGYGGTMDAPDMRHEGRGELQKKSPGIISGIF